MSITFSVRAAIAASSATIAGLVLSACAGNAQLPSGSDAPALSPQTAADFSDASKSPMVRAIHGSPDAGPVDIYVYPKGTGRPKKPAIAAAEYPQITDFLSVPSGDYTIDVLPRGGKAKAVASEEVKLMNDARYSVVVGGKVADRTLRFVNFVDPNESAKATALVVHHASPYVENALKGPVAVGVYDASKKLPPAIPTLFEFALAKGTSGPAKSGHVSGGEYFLSPLPSSLPASVGFAAGAPGSAGQFAPLIDSSIRDLVKGLKHPTKGQEAIAKDKASEIPADAHLSVFAIDTPKAARLIGSLDP